MHLNPADHARRAAGFGLLAAASTSPGQTFFVGLFGSAFRESFQLSDAALGSLYAVATLASGLLMFWLGELADRLAMRRAITLSVGMVIAGSLLLATAIAPLQLGIGLFLLRLGGQGLTGHFAIVAAVRFSGRLRGRSTATAAMGFILGEAFYPLLVTAALGMVDWRTVWAAIAIILLLVYLPALRQLAKPFPVPNAIPDAQPNENDVDWNRRALFVSAPFLGTLGIVLVPPFVITALFFHQSALGYRLDWSAERIAQAFLLFAFCQAIATFVSGRLIDSFGARAIMRFYLLPLAAGLLATFTLDGAVALWMLFAGLGFTAGSNSVIGGAVWVEIFGNRKLGLIRGMYAALMVLSTAASPALLGALLSAGIELAPMFLPVIVYVVILPLLLVPLTRTQGAVA